MITALLLCALLFAIVYCTYVNYKAEEEWRIVKEFPEWELINKSKDRIFRDIHVDVQTYSRFQNVRSDNILKYCNVSTLSDLSKARVDSSGILGKLSFCYVILLRVLTTDYVNSS